MLKVAALWNDKARAAADGRERWEEKLSDQLDGVDSNRRLVFHAPSVGEFLQARAVLDLLLDRYPDIAAVVTHFSPSAEKIVNSFERAAARAYLPFDTLRNVRRFFEIVDPDFIAFSRADIWPNFSKEAARRGVPAVLIAGSLSEPMGWLFNPIQRFARRGLGHLKFVGAISEEDAELFKQAGVDPAAIIVTGDPRCDQTWERARSVNPSDKIFDPFPKGGFNFIAGSTWPDDERIIIPAFAKLRADYPEVRLILAPHEPSSGRIANIEKSLDNHRLDHAALSELENNGPKDVAAIIVDRVGILAQLYRLGNVAFVGGSFVRRVHNVMEPACFTLPVIVGPYHRNSREAIRMIRAKGCFPVGDERTMLDLIKRFIEDEDSRTDAGSKAMELVKSGRGAAARTVEALQESFPEIFPTRLTEVDSGQ